MPPSKTVIFWGAGATAALGIRTTADQTAALRKLAGEEGSVNERVKEALGQVDRQWTDAFSDLLTILGDQHQGSRLNIPSQRQLTAMRRNWPLGASDDDLKRRVLYLCALYDWPALKEVVRVCPGYKGDALQLADLFNVLDMHGQSGHGFEVQKGSFLTPAQVSAAYNALKMLLNTLFYVDWQCALADDQRRSYLDHHYEFAWRLGRRMQDRGVQLAADCQPIEFQTQKFYLGDVGFVSLNYDPIALWCQFVANRQLNTDLTVPYVGAPASKLQIFHDLGYIVATARVINRAKPLDLFQTLWHPMNESAAARLNDPDHGATDRIRITKFLLPHGCLWWRECPSCGKLSSYMGDTWKLDSATLIPPPPLRAFTYGGQFRYRFQKEEAKWDEGEVDARACMHCQELTYAHHTVTRMQSNFKERPPPFLDQIERDSRVLVQDANHIILMGYSLPPDDVDYRAFFAVRRKRKDDVKCTVVGLERCERRRQLRWFPPAEIERRMSHMDDQTGPPFTTLKAAIDIFGERNVRYYDGGVPDVFLEGGAVTESAVNELLTWSANEDR